MGRRRSETCAAGQWGRTRLRRRLRRRCRCGWMATRSATVLRAPVRLPAEAELRHTLGSCSSTTATAKSLDVEVWTSTSFRFFFSLFFLRAAGLLSSQFRGFVSFSVFHRVIDIFFCFSFANFFQSWLRSQLHSQLHSGLLAGVHVRRQNELQRCSLMCFPADFFNGVVSSFEFSELLPFRVFIDEQTFH